MAIVTGKAVTNGGIRGRTTATGRGCWKSGDVFISDKAWMDLVGLPVGWKNKKIIVQGFGNVGMYACMFGVQAGAKVVGILERDAKIYDPNGLDVKVITVLWFGIKLQIFTLSSDG